MCLHFALLCFLFEEKWLDVLLDPPPRGFKPLDLIDLADGGLDAGGIAQAIEELIAGEAALHLRINAALPALDPGPDVKLEHGIADPSISAESSGFTRR